MSDNSGFKDRDFGSLSERKSIEIHHMKVPPNQYRSIVIPSHIRIPYLLHTQGRLGCDAVVLVTRTKDGQRIVDMTHFDANQLEKHISVINKLAKEHPKGVNYSAILSFYFDYDDPVKKLKKELDGFSHEIDIMTISMDQIYPLDEYAKPSNLFLDQLMFIGNQGENMGFDIVKVGGRKILKQWTKI